MSLAVAADVSKVRRRVLLRNRKCEGLSHLRPLEPISDGLLRALTYSVVGRSEVVVLRKTFRTSRKAYSWR